MHGYAAMRSCGHALRKVSLDDVKSISPSPRDLVATSACVPHIAGFEATGLCGYRALGTQGRCELTEELQENFIKPLDS